MDGVWAALLPVITLLIGFSLNEFAVWNRGRHGDKRIVSRVLSGLLEQRHEILAFQTLKTVLADFPLALQDQATVSAYLRKSLLPQVSHWRGQYREAVEELAGVDALLAFQLRHKEKDLFGVVTAMLPDGNDPAALGQLAMAESTVTTIQLSTVEELIGDVARAHGIRATFRMRRHLHPNEAERTAEAKKILNDLGLSLNKKL